MHSTQKLNILRKILIIVFFFTCFPIIIIYIFSRDISSLNSLFNDYITSGYSLFFPYLPYNNIIFRFTTGHLIDIVIIINILTIIERSGYYYYVSVCLKKNYLEECNYLDLYSLESTKNPNQASPKLNLILQFNNESRDLFNEESQDFKSEKNLKYYILSEKKDVYMRKSGYINGPNNVNLIGIHTLFKNYYSFVINYFSIFQNLMIMNINNNHLPPKNSNNLSKPDKNISQEGFIY